MQLLQEVRQDNRIFSAMHVESQSLHRGMIMKEESLGTDLNL